MELHEERAERDRGGSRGSAVLACTGPLYGYRGCDLLYYLSRAAVNRRTGIRKMKKGLFYTFLFQFVIVFAITVMGLLQIVAMDKTYLDKLFYLLITESVWSVIGLYRKTRFFHDTDGESDVERSISGAMKRETTSPVGHEETGSQSVSHPVLSGGVRLGHPLPAEGTRLQTPEAYFQTYDALHDRFGEREVFQRRSHAELVTWRGRIISMSTHRDTVSVQLDAVTQDPRHSFFASFPLATRERVFSLHKDDLIEVTGLLKTDNMPDAPSVETDDFALIEKSSDRSVEGTA